MRWVELRALAQAAVDPADPPKRSDVVPAAAYVEMCQAFLDEGTLRDAAENELATRTEMYEQIRDTGRVWGQ
jgi:hypothetical protein